MMREQGETKQRQTKTTVFFCYQTLEGQSSTVSDAVDVEESTEEAKALVARKKELSG
jgi:hypothetical protein